MISGANAGNAGSDHEYVEMFHGLFYIRPMTGSNAPVIAEA